MLWCAEKLQAVMFVLRTGSLYLFAIIPFWLWQGHAHLTNSAAPDLDYIAHNRKMINNGHWYFGTLEQRVSTYHWKVLLQRGVFDMRVWAVFPLDGAMQHVYLYKLGDL